MLNIPELEAVDICTPNLYYSEIAVAALNRGIHVFCEKPDAISVAECMKMKEAAEKSEKVLMVMRNNRFLSTSTYLKNYINDGKMGKIYAGRCGWIRRRGIPGRGGWFTTKALSGGGPLIDLCTHDRSFRVADGESEAGRGQWLYVPGVCRQRTVGFCQFGFRR